MSQHLPAVHLGLVSAQATPNLTPALDPATAPRRMILAVSPGMASRADALAAVLAPRGIAVEFWPLDDAYDIEHLRQRFLDLAAREEASAPALNATGGTKPMAMAAYEVFRSLGWPIFYVHPERDRLVWLSPSDWPARDLANRVTLAAFLSAHGAEPAERPAGFGTPGPLLRLGEGLVERIDRYLSALPVLNWAAAAARDSLVSPPLSAGQRARHDVENLFGWFEAEGLLEISEGRVRFADEAARFFANGGWLEQYVYAQVQAVRRELPDIQDVGRGLEVTRRVGEERVRNELDVVFLAENRLYIVECKTRRFAPEPEDGGPGAETLYKLETLAPLLGGLRARAMLASYQPLEPHVLRRARDYGILTCAGPELRDLQARLRAWVGSTRRPG